MRVNPKLANLQFLYANDQAATGLPEGTYSNLAAAKYLKDNDKNKDGVLSQDEVTLSEEAYAKLDADKNGKIDLKEMKAALKGQDAAIEAYYKNKKAERGKTDVASTLLASAADQDAGKYTAIAAERFVKDNDADKDGGLSRQEAALSEAAFAKLDQDNNGRLVQKEVQAGIRAKEESYKTLYMSNASSRAIADLTSSLLKTI